MRHVTGLGDGRWLCRCVVIGVEEVKVVYRSWARRALIFS